MKTLALAALLAVALVAVNGRVGAAQAYRTWTSADTDNPQTFVGKLVRIDRDNVVFMKPADGKQYTCAKSLFSKSDQNFISRIEKALSFRSSTKQGNKAIDVVQVIARPVARNNGSVKWLIAVGINAYEHFGPLRACVNDAVGIQTCLKPLGFHHAEVLTVKSTKTPCIDVTQIQDKIDDLLGIHDAQNNVILPGKAQTDDTVVIMLSGHGCFIGDTGYFCAPEADASRAGATMVSMNELLSQLGNSPAKTKVLIVDACRNAVQGQRGVAPGKQLKTKKLAQLLGKGRRGVYILNSCEPGKISHEGPKNGVYIQRVIEAMKGAYKPGKKSVDITIPEIHAYVAKQLVGLQKPTMTPLNANRGLLGTLERTISEERPEIPVVQPKIPVVPPKIPKVEMLNLRVNLSGRGGLGDVVDFVVETAGEKMSFRSGVALVVVTYRFRRKLRSPPNGKVERRRRNTEFEKARRSA